jgi:hypothetical protein
VLHATRLRKAFESLSWPKTEAELTASNFSARDVPELSAILVQSDRLLLRHDRTREPARNRLFKQLTAFVAKRAGEDASHQVAAACDAMQTLEQGYHAILDALGRSSAGKLAPTDRVMAALIESAQSFDAVFRETLAHTTTTTENLMHHGVVLHSETGEPVSPDGAVESIVRAATDVIMMEAHTQRWFSEQGTVMIPLTPEFRLGENVAGSIDQYLAACWREWQAVEERFRYQGGELKARPVEALGDDVPPGFRSAKVGFVYAAPEDAVRDRILLYCARERLRRRFSTDAFTLEYQSSIKERVRSWKTAQALAPQEYASIDEALGLLVLGTLLAYPVHDDETTYGRLTIVEWLRVFAVLRGFARERYDADGSAGLLQTVTREELRELFVHAGLTQEVAGNAIAQLRLSRSSRDMYDAPLLQISDDAFLVFGPTLAVASLAPIVMSVIQSLGSIGKKGAAFEEHMRQTFKAQPGIRCETLTFRVKRETYEYDGLVEWGDYLFVLECKSRALPRDDARLECQFLDEAAGDFHQMRRLLSGLKQNPERLQQLFGPDILKKTIVPCILHALPFVQEPSEEGIYVADAAMIERFFESRYFRVLVPHTVGETTLLHRVNFASQWSGDSPTAEDFVALLKSTPQLAVVLPSTSFKPVWFHMDENTIAGYGRVSADYTSLDDDVEHLGGNAQAVRDEIAKGEAFAREMRQKVLEAQAAPQIQDGGE